MNVDGNYLGCIATGLKSGKEQSLKKRLKLRFESMTLNHWSCFFSNNFTKHPNPKIDVIFIIDGSLKFEVFVTIFIFLLF